MGKTGSSVGKVVTRCGSCLSLALRCLHAHNPPTSPKNAAAAPMHIPASAPFDSPAGAGAVAKIYRLTKTWSVSKLNFGAVGIVAGTMVTVGME
jgi:hypothetical protein